MDLYDDIDTKPKANHIDGWSSGIKMLQTQLALKKAQFPREPIRKQLMNPLVNLRSKRSNDTEIPKINHIRADTVTTTPAPKLIIEARPLSPVMDCVHADEWDFDDEYDPQWPNEYEKIKENEQSKQKSKDNLTPARLSKQENSGSSDRKRGRNRNTMQHDINTPKQFSGFAQCQQEEDRYSPPTPSVLASKGGATIAPPPSLQEFSIANENGDSSSNVTIPYTANSVAAKIMAKYGFKDGQGLGKQEQGMAMALQVEKTSKRGGRIIHEKDVLLPPPASPISPSIAPINPTPLSNSPRNTNFGSLPPPAAVSAAINETPFQTADEPSITEIMKAPSKVVLLRNMVGPGDVDEELEPEVKDECNTKYGEVVSVLIHESFGTTPEDAVKIFVEFKRIESAIKAVVDLNGRFFGGRQVRAGFYNYDKFKNFQLN